MATVTLSWTNPSGRFDLHRIIMRRAAGSTAPATVTDGTGVTLGSDLATSVADTGLAAGTYSYSAFAGYDEINSPPSSSAKFSAPASITVVVP